MTTREQSSSRQVAKYGLSDERDPIWSRERYKASPREGMTKAVSRASRMISGLPRGKALCFGSKKIRALVLPSSKVRPK